MNRWTRSLIMVLAVAVIAEITFGQDWRRGRGISRDRNGVPTWDTHPTMPKDVFTFVRLEFDSSGRGQWGRGGGWRVDWPEADLNFSYRLEEMTALKTNPDPIYLRLTDPAIFDYPFVYMIEPGSLYLSPEEIEAFRQYLSSGGFLMVDDFWGEEEWENFYYYFSQVFPGRELVELDVEHPIFNTPFPIKRKPQIPNVRTGTEHVLFGTPTWEQEDAKVPHYRALFDDNGRMMAIICHNTDLGDGWEEEATSPEYFKEFSEKSAYPLGINIIFHAMTQ
ncbi:MAG TPA: DUF4159 domain-containing protein [Verrucomicrobiae bacterium]|nr:DUF4159 domain-containing protein [Verrucomicrobiae bacterium]